MTYVEKPLTGPSMQNRFAISAASLRRTRFVMRVRTGCEQKRSSERSTRRNQIHDMARAISPHMMDKKASVRYMAAAAVLRLLSLVPVDDATQMATRR